MEGPKQAHLIAYSRGESVAVLAPRWNVKLGSGFGSTTVELPPGNCVLDIPIGLVPRALRDIQAGQAAGRFTVPDAEIALSAAAGGMLGLFRMRQRHPERVTEATVDQLAEAELRLLGVPAPEAARLTALPLPPTGTW